ncbi:hypothetical protein C8R43DRAFT_978715 [Mycena crocata]|nr:hypothetical protein C8R43DRAFT_978715 [Mycena crocata]
MAPAASALVSSAYKALVRLIKFLFGGGHAAKDIEVGLPVPADKGLGCKKEPVVELKPAVPTFRPEIVGLSGLVVSSLRVSAAFTPGLVSASGVIVFSGYGKVPSIVLTPPVMDNDVQPALMDSNTDKGTSPAGSARAIAILADKRNIPARVHGTVPRKHRSKRVIEKENIRAHPNAPRRTQAHAAPPPPAPYIPRAASLADAKPATDAGPSSSGWMGDKTRSLQQLAEWSEMTKTRRRSFPTPPPSVIRRASAPASSASPRRIPLEERLRGLVSPMKVAPPAPLWGDSNATFVVGDDSEDDDDDAHQTRAITAPRVLPPSDSASSIGSLLDAFENDFRLPAWLSLRTPAQLEAGLRGYVEQERETDTWSDMVSLDDYV